MNLKPLHQALPSHTQRRPMRLKLRLMNLKPLHKAHPSRILPRPLNKPTVVMGMGWIRAKVKM